MAHVCSDHRGCPKESFCDTGGTESCTPCRKCTPERFPNCQSRCLTVSEPGGGSSSANPVLSIATDPSTVPSTEISPDQLPLIVFGIIITLPLILIVIVGIVLCKNCKKKAEILKSLSCCKKKKSDVINNLPSVGTKPYNEVDRYNCTQASQHPPNSSDSAHVTTDRQTLLNDDENSGTEKEFVLKDTGTDTYSLNQGLYGSQLSMLVIDETQREASKLTVTGDHSDQRLKPKNLSDEENSQTRGRTNPGNVGTNQLGKLGQGDVTLDLIEDALKKSQKNEEGNYEDQNQIEIPRKNKRKAHDERRKGDSNAAGKASMQGSQPESQKHRVRCEDDTHQTGDTEVQNRKDDETACDKNEVKHEADQMNHNSKANRGKNSNVNTSGKQVTNNANQEGGGVNRPQVSNGKAAETPGKSTGRNNSKSTGRSGRPAGETVGQSSGNSAKTPNSNKEQGKIEAGAKQTEVKNKPGVKPKDTNNKPAGVKPTETGSKPSQRSDRETKSSTKTVPEDTRLQLDLFSNVFIPKEEPRTEIDATQKCVLEAVDETDNDPERQPLLVVNKEMDEPHLSIQCYADPEPQGNNPVAEVPSVRFIDGGRSHQGSVQQLPSRENDSGCGSVVGGGAEGGVRWSSLTPSQEFRVMTERHMAERGVVARADDQLAFPQQVSDGNQAIQTEDEEVKEFERMFPGFIHPSKQRNRWIYDQLKKVDWVMGYYSSGESIEVYVNLGSLDPHVVEQQLADITGADISKFHAKQNEEPVYDYDI